MILLAVIFWLAVAGIAYTWVGYPILLRTLASRFGRDRSLSDTESQLTESQLTESQSTRNDGPYRPTVSLIIAAHKEEAVIEERLVNACACDYPADNLEILIGVDGDRDGTGSIVQNYPDGRVKLLQFPERRGKASVLNDSAVVATGDILVFSDANTMFAADAIAKLVEHFEDPSVGGVCGQLELIDYSDGSNADGAYWKFENFLKRNEATLGGLLGFNGAIYAIRRDSYKPIPADTIVDDFLIGMRVHLNGRRLIYEPAAKAHEESAPTAAGEFSRRVRIGSGNIQSLRELWPLLNPLQGAVAFTFASHKVLRWMVPVLLLLALGTNVGLVGHRVYQATLIAQLAFYFMSGIGFLLSSSRGWRKLLRIPSLFVSLNLALLIGMVRVVASPQTGMWDPTDRSAEDVSV